MSLWFQSIICIVLGLSTCTLAQEQLPSSSHSTSVETQTEDEFKENTPSLHSEITLGNWRVRSGESQAAAHGQDKFIFSNNETRISTSLFTLSDKVYLKALNIKELAGQKGKVLSDEEALLYYVQMGLIHSSLKLNDLLQENLNCKFNPYISKVSRDERLGHFYFDISLKFFHPLEGTQHSTLMRFICLGPKQEDGVIMIVGFEGEELSDFLSNLEFSPVETKETPSELTQ